MSDLNAGEVEITLGDDTLVLKPTPAAALAISSFKDDIGTGISAAMRGVDNQNIFMQAAVIKAAAGIPDKTAKDLSTRVFLAGTFNLRTPLQEFLAMLMNGGKPFVAKEEGEDPGNAPG
jgi:hypothetical protein